MSTKNDVLSLLNQNCGRPASGQKIAQILGISRSAVWKAIQSLRSEGYQISAGTNNGYQLIQDINRLSDEEIRLYLAPEYKKSPIFLYKIIDSTNTQAKRLALDKAPHGTILAAEEQTAGRGRFGRSFFSPKDTGVYMSIILRPNMSFDNTQMITVASAVAVCRAVEKLTQLQLQIKWVNDLFLNGKKVAGILTEAAGSFESGQIESMAVGIGINCTTAQVCFPFELQGIAGSLNIAGLSRNRLIAEIANGIFYCIKHLDDPSIIEEYKSRSLVLGKEILYERSQKTVSATVLDINNKGNLIVRAQDGSVETLYSGEVAIISKI